MKCAFLDPVADFQKRKLPHFGLAFLGNICSLLVVMSSKKLQYLPEY
jgi:hypothetical protein